MWRRRGAEIDRAVTAFRPRRITSLTLIIHFQFNVSVGAFHLLLVLQLPLRFCNFHLVTMGNSYSSLHVVQLSFVEAAVRVDKVFTVSNSADSVHLSQ